MAEHYCTEHNTVFFKKGGMKGFAHPIGDTGKWCNEPESTESIPESPEKPIQRSNGQNKSFAIAYAKDLAVAGKIEADKILSYAEVFSRYMNGDITVQDEAVFTALLKKVFQVE